MKHWMTLVPVSMWQSGPSPYLRLVGARVGGRPPPEAMRQTPPPRLPAVAGLSAPSIERSMAGKRSHPPTPGAAAKSSRPSLDRNTARWWLGIQGRQLVAGPLLRRKMQGLGDLLKVRTKSCTYPSICLLIACLVMAFLFRFLLPF